MSVDIHLESEEGDDVLFYVLLRGVERFHEECSRYPGQDNHHVEPDIPLLKVQCTDYCTVSKYCDMCTLYQDHDAVGLEPLEVQCHVRCTDYFLVG